MGLKSHVQRESNTGVCHSDQLQVQSEATGDSFSLSDDFFKKLLGDIPCGIQNRNSDCGNQRLNVKELWEAA